VCYFHHTGFHHISLGFHFDFRSPNIEVHLPFGFIRIGWMGTLNYEDGEFKTLWPGWPQPLPTSWKLSLKRGMFGYCR
jgi:hypothetical protein